MMIHFAAKCTQRTYSLTTHSKLRVMLLTKTVTLLVLPWLLMQKCLILNVIAAHIRLFPADPLILLIFGKTHSCKYYVKYHLHVVSRLFYEEYKAITR